MQHRLRVQTPRRECFVEISHLLEEAVRTAGVDEGICHVFVPHTTAGVTVNENADPAVIEDALAQFSALVPALASFKHAEGNSDAHIKAMLTGSSVAAPVSGRRLALGRWQGVFLCEFDGPRTREVVVTFLA